VPSGFLVGVSAHTPADLERAAAAGADYAFYGPVFATRSHPGAPGLGRAGLAAALAGAGLPVWAIGGVTPATALALAGLPLAGCAAIRGLLTAADLPAVLAALAAVPTSPP
jgi:thiamine monophosphate synthase